MLCFLGAVAATVVVRQVLGMTGVNRYLPAPALVTIAFLVTFTLGGWLLWVD
jgi:ABC-type nickel/cobalt efflux system permease component RcnA